MRWLLDEMLPYPAAEALHDLGHDAVSLFSLGLLEAGDAEVYSVALSEGRVVVTEDAGGFVPLAKEDLLAGRPSVPIVLVRKERLARGGAMASDLAEALHRWSLDHPDPYPGPHWL